MARPRKDDLPPSNILNEVNWNYSIGPGKRFIDLPKDLGTTRATKDEYPPPVESQPNKGYRRLRGRV